MENNNQDKKQTGFLGYLKAKGFGAILIVAIAVIVIAILVKVTNVSQNRKIEEERLADQAVSTEVLLEKDEKRYEDMMTGETGLVIEYHGANSCPACQEYQPNYKEYIKGSRIKHKELIYDVERTDEEYAKFVEEVKADDIEYYPTTVYKVSNKPILKIVGDLSVEELRNIENFLGRNLDFVEQQMKSGSPIEIDHGELQELLDKEDDLKVH